MNCNGSIKTEHESVPAQNEGNKGKRGRKKKSTEEHGSSLDNKKAVLKQEMITDHMPVVKKKRKIDRFNGMPEEEVILKTLPDRLAPNLDILIIGINPGLYAAYIGHHYAGPGNHFWKCLYLSGLVPEPMNCYDDIKLQEFGIGFTNICARTTRGSADLKKPEIQEGGNILREKLKELKPKIAVFNGKGIYEIFSGSKKFIFGKQPELIEGTETIAYVMPSSSARCSQLPRASDKVPFYEALRRLRDYVVGRLPHLTEADVTFPTLELKTVKKEEPRLLPVNTEANCSGDDDSLQGVDDAGVNMTLQQNGLGNIKQEGKKRSRPKGKGKGDQQDQRDNNQFIMADQQDGNEPQQTVPQVSTTQHQNPQVFYNPQQTTGPLPTALGSHHNPFPSANMASFSSTDSSSSQVFQAPFAFAAAAVGTVTPVVSSPAQDYMSGFYTGSQQFGMVGFPAAVASQQEYLSLTEHGSEQRVVRVKSEPVE